jgi:solute carrier family 35 (adenosine 3'-phospho 5'-phosphosulfate transporter), member B2
MPRARSPVPTQRAAMPASPAPPPPPPAAAPLTVGRAAHLAGCAAAIFASLVLYGVLQERIMTRPYFAEAGRSPGRVGRAAGNGAWVESWRRGGAGGAGGRAGDGDYFAALMRRRKIAPVGHENGGRVVPPPAEGDLAAEAADGALFKSSLFLVLANRVVAVLLTLAVIAARRDYRRDVLPAAPLMNYVAVSVSNVIATSCQYEALKWLTFPTLTVGKCAKMLPVMLILNLRSGRRYSTADFAVASAVAAGAAIMITSGSVSAAAGGVPADDAFGFALLAAYLLFDAVTSTMQDFLFQRYAMSVYNQMLFINLSTGCLSALGLLVSGSLLDSLAFTAAYPSAVPDIAALSLSAVAGQFAISHTIHAFGALAYAAIMTARQFCSVLLSNLLFEHGLNAAQWAGACLVFGALFARVAVRAKAEAAADGGPDKAGAERMAAGAALHVRDDAAPAGRAKLLGGGPGAHSIVGR